MIDGTRSSADGHGDEDLDDPVLIEWAAELADRVQADETVDFEEFARRDPDRAERLRRMLPTILAMAKLDRRDGRGARAGLSDDPALDLPDDSRCLGDFLIVREIGRGGMGIVYEARQLSLNRRVALKVLSAAAALDPRQLQRFQLEAQALACLSHPHVVPVFSVGRERGVSYYVMPLIEGRRLAKLIRELRWLEGVDEPAPGGSAYAQSLWVAALRRGSDSRAGMRTAIMKSDGPAARAKTTEPEVRGDATPDSDASRPEVRKPQPSPTISTSYRDFFQTVARFGRQAAEALAHAHRQGVLHRDVKPANLLVDVSGELWVADFGLARLQGNSDFTRTGELIGTLRWMR